MYYDMAHSAYHNGTMDMLTTGWLLTPPLQHFSILTSQLSVIVYRIRNCLRIELFLSPCGLCSVKWLDYKIRFSGRKNDYTYWEATLMVCTKHKTGKDFLLLWQNGWWKREQRAAHRAPNWRSAELKVDVLYSSLQYSTSH